MTEEEQGQPFPGDRVRLSPAEVRDSLAASGLSPLSRLGQNFLVDGNVAEKIISALDPGIDDLIIEIGPGPGYISAVLAAKAGRFLAVEIDPGMAAMTEQRLAAWPSARVVKANALKVDLAALVASGAELPARVVDGPARETAGGPHRLKFFSNLPYYITTPLLMKILEENRNFPPGFAAAGRAIFMVQREVADRILASPGGKEYGVLTLAVQYYSKPTLVAMVSRRSFWPAPDVDSALVQLEFRDISAAPLSPEEFFPVVRGAFGQRRKKVANSLAAYPALEMSRDEARLALEAIGVDSDRRGETLSMEEFVRLAIEWRHLKAGRAAGDSLEGGNEFRQPY